MSKHRISIATLETTVIGRNWPLNHDRVCFVNDTDLTYIVAFTKFWPFDGKKPSANAPYRIGVPGKSETPWYNVKRSHPNSLTGKDNPYWYTVTSRKTGGVANAKMIIKP